MAFKKWSRSEASPFTAGTVPTVPTVHRSGALHGSGLEESLDLRLQGILLQKAFRVRLLGAANDWRWQKKVVKTKGLMDVLMFYDLLWFWYDFVDVPKFPNMSHVCYLIIYFYFTRLFLAVMLRIVEMSSRLRQILYSFIAILAFELQAESPFCSCELSWIWKTHGLPMKLLPKLLILCAFPNIFMLTPESFLPKTVNRRTSKPKPGKQWRNTQKSSKITKPQP